MKKIKSRNEKKRFLKNIQGCCVVFFVILAIFKGFFVDAGTDDSSLSKNRMNNVFALATYQGQSRIFYLNKYTLNNVVSYCIELGVDITYDLYNSTEDFGLSYLSSDAIDYIRSVSYFGPSYPGHDDYRYYMAVQELIWEYITGGEIEWATEASFNGTRIDIESYKSQILSLRDSYVKDLHFDDDIANIYRIGQKIVLNDSSGSLFWYEVESSGHSKVWIEGNTLQIELSDTYVGEEKIILKRLKNYDFNGKLYYKANSQKLISVGNLDEKYYEMSFSIQGESLQFQLIDGESGEMTPRLQTSFEGATYELYDSDDNLLETLMTDMNGQVIVENIPYGDYMVKQINPSKGYLNNDSEFLITFEKGDQVIYLEQFPIFQEVEILKLYDYEGSGISQPEIGISFSIFDIYGNNYGDIVTDESGIASIVLGYGQYVFQQDNTTEGYLKVSNFDVFVEGVSEGKVRYNLLDDFIECQLKIVVMDQKRKDVNLGEGFWFKIWDEQNQKYLNYDGEEVFSTNEFGVVDLPFILNYGKYRVEQVEVPKGYLELGQIIEVVINEHSVFEVINNRLQLTVEFYQEKLNGNVHVMTEKEYFVAEENDYGYDWEIRPNVMIDLISKEDLYIYDEKIFDSGEVVQTIFTDEKGEVILKELPLGDYCLVERESKLEKCFDLLDGNYSDNGFVLDVNLRIYLEKMSVEFTDYDENGREIENVVVEVLDSEGKVIYTGITDSNGNFKVNDLSGGNYCFHQKKIGSTYLLNEENVCVEINSSQAVWKVQMINSLVPKRWIFVPNTYDEKKSFLKLGILFLCSLGVIFYKKIFHFH